MNSRHKGILNRHLCKNFFEKSRMPVIFWIFKYGRKRLSSNKESHWLSCEYCEIFKNTFFTEQLRWLLLLF